MPHKVEQIYVKPSLPVCQHTITDEKVIEYRRRETGVTNDLCGFVANYRIDGKYLCKRHAQALALEILLEQSK